MATYRNDFDKQEDELLWELHEIRHQLSEEYKSMSAAEVNERALVYWEQVKRRTAKAATP